jgi:hypothetical protein
MSRSCVLPRFAWATRVSASPQSDWQNKTSSNCPDIASSDRSMGYSDINDATLGRGTVAIFENYSGYL